MDGSTTSTGESGSKGGKSGKGGGKSTQSKGGDGKTNKEVDPKVAAMDGGENPMSSTPTTTSQERGKGGEKVVAPTFGEPVVQPPAAQPQPTTGEIALVQEVTSLLKSLRTESAAIKVCSVRRISGSEEQVVLLDGGATHCLRECKGQEEWESAKEIRVALAEGETVMKQVEKTKTLVTQERVQPIVPMCLVTALGYKVEWTAGDCKIHHPTQGQLPVTLCQGCPTLPLADGLALMEKVEKLRSERAVVRSMLAGECVVDPQREAKFEVLKKWFSQVPLDILQKVPGNQQWNPESLPWNRRRRRQVEKAKNLIIYMFSGPNEGEWLRWQDKATAILCLDILIGVDLLNNDVAGWIEHLTTTRHVKMWISSPPCRTVSVCRHDEDGGPPVLRGGGDQDRFGLPNLLAHHQRQVEQDGVLWLRNLFWMALAFRTSGGTMEALIEQPRDPNEWKEPIPGGYPTFLRWEETKHIQEELGLRSIVLEQGALGHQTTKPTTLLSSVPETWSLHGLKRSRKRGAAGGMKEEESTFTWPSSIEERIQKSRSLSAWAPGLKSALWKAIERVKRDEPPTMARLSAAEMEDLKAWDEHIRRGHCPYRKDCAICVETRGRDRRHLRQEHVDAFTLSLGKPGPYEPGYDQHVTKPRYYLTGVVTIPKIGSNPLVDGLRRLGGELMSLESQPSPLPSSTLSARRQEPSVLATVNGGRGLLSDKSETPPNLKPIQPAEEEQQVEEGEGQESDAFPVQQDEEKLELSVTEIAEAEALDRQWAECMQGRAHVEVDNLSQSIPLRSRSTKDVIHATALLYTRLKSLQIPVNRVHTDRAKEFLSKEFRQWTLAREIRQSTTAGDESQTNGRVENELGQVRGMARSLLKSAKLPTSYWPLAIRAASESRFRSQLRGMGIPVAEPLPFGLQAYAHQKRWHRTSDWQSPKQLVTLLGPAADMTMTSGGYYAELPNGKCILTTAVIVPTTRLPAEINAENPVNPAHPAQEVLRGEARAETHLDDLADQEGSPELFADQVNESITEIEVEPKCNAGLGERQRFPKTIGLTHRLQGKQTVLNEDAMSPTISRIALRAMGEEENPHQDVFGERWHQEVVWMLFQQQALGQAAQELVADIQEGVGSEMMTRILQQVQRESRTLEARLRVVQGIEEGTTKATGDSEILQTKTVSMQEVKENHRDWKAPFQEEYETLKKTVIKPLSASEVKKEIAMATKVQRVPGKLVATLKPPFQEAWSHCCLR